MSARSGRRAICFVAAGLAMLCLTRGAAWADENKRRDRVRMGPTTVTVIDEGESINDVISRVRERRQQAREQRQDQRQQRRDGKDGKGKDALDGKVERNEGAGTRPRLREILRNTRDRDPAAPGDRLSPGERQEARREARAEARRERLQKLRQRREDGDLTTRPRREAP